LEFGSDDEETPEHSVKNAKPVPRRKRRPKRFIPPNSPISWTTVPDEASEEFTEMGLDFDFDSAATLPLLTRKHSFDLSSQGIDFVIDEYDIDELLPETTGDNSLDDCTDVDSEVENDCLDDLLPDDAECEVNSHMEHLIAHIDPQMKIVGAEEISSEVDVTDQGEVVNERYILGADGRTCFLAASP
jgi:hypothetical protein